MSQIIMVTGGGRSGKSDFALNLATEKKGEKQGCFIATCPRLDVEMTTRINKHIADRQEKNWTTIEECIHLERELEQINNNSFVIIDCLTLWVNNLMYREEKLQKKISEVQIKDKTLQLVEKARAFSHTVVAVTSEVGMGIVPGNPSSRLFRDLTGRCNQVFAEASDSCYLICSGIPLKIK